MQHKSRSSFEAIHANKPHKWEVNLFVLCDSNGYAYCFKIYHGAGDDVVLPNAPDLGATSNVVVTVANRSRFQKSHNLLRQFLQIDSAISIFAIERH